MISHKGSNDFKGEIPCRCAWVLDGLLGYALEYKYRNQLSKISNGFLFCIVSYSFTNPVALHGLIVGQAITTV